MSTRTTGWRAFAVTCLVLSAAVAALTMASSASPSLSQPPPQGSLTLVPNSSFEEIDGDHPAGWKRAVWQRSAELSVDTVAHTGAHSARISSRDGGDASWTVVVPVRPFSTYRLSGWIKTEGLENGTSRGALFNLHQLSRMQTPAVTGTRDWTEVTLEFDTEANDAIQINCLFGGWGRARGTAWFDDVRLELLATRDLKPEVRIDTAATRAPMSPFIYGQFIEHLGRCIYGGIWAEMLEDRKFFYGIGARESPWSAVGPPGAVTMSADAPFVGSHTPVVNAPGGESPAGIAQGALALISGRRYTGHIVLSGDQAAAPVRVSLVWGNGPSDRTTVSVPALSAAYESAPLSFLAGGTTDSGRLEVTTSGHGVVRIGTISLMPADNVEGFRPDVLVLLRELNAPVYRWPGGNFVSGYNWRDGIGDRDRRPPRKNPAWQGVEHNDVGIHEFMALCRLIGTEPYIAVNSGLGDVSSAADEVEYVNGAASSPMGKLRAQNGHEQPFNVPVLVGWKRDVRGLAARAHATGGVREEALAVRRRDAGARPANPGHRRRRDGRMGRGHAGQLREGHGLHQRALLLQREAGAAGPRLADPARDPAHRECPPRVQEDHPGAGGHRHPDRTRRVELLVRAVPLRRAGYALLPEGRAGHRRGHSRYSRQSDIIFMANYAQTVNVIGAIKTSKTSAAFETTGLVLKLYRGHFGTIPVATTGSPEPLDVAAAWTADRKTLTVAIVNPTRSVQPLKLLVSSLRLPASARLWRITGENEAAFNEPGKPAEVTIQETSAVKISSPLAVPPLSVSIYELSQSRSPNRK